MKILHISPTFYPAAYWGGPIFSTYGLCNALAADKNIDLRVLTTDAAGPQLRDRVHTDRIPIRFSAGYDVYFTRRIIGREIAPGLIFRMMRLVIWADAIHLTGTYSFPTLPALLLCRITGKPVVWSPRGGLQRWESSSRPIVKKIWEKLCNLLAKKGKTILHITSREECQASVKRIPNARATMIPNAVEVPEKLLPRDWQPENRLRSMFLGRLDPIKGLEPLLESLALLRNPVVSLDIYGTGDSAYLAKLIKLVQSLGLDNQVEFQGALDPEKKEDAFAKSDLLVLPSHSENFGMVVAESLAHGVPVIVSQGTPWESVHAKDCGWWVKNDPESLAAAFSKALVSDLRLMGLAGQDWMKADFSWESVAADMKTTYLSLVNP